MTSDPRDSRGPQNQAERAQTPPARQPFDTSDLHDLPHPNDSDPPYRPFWVEDGKS